MCLWKVLSGQPGQNFISGHESEQSEALFLFPVSTHWTYSSGGLGRHAVHAVLSDTLTHMKPLTALMWPHVCSEAKHSKWEFSSLDFMAYVTGSGHGFAVMCTDLAKPFLNRNLKIKSVAWNTVKERVFWQSLCSVMNNQGKFYYENWGAMYPGLSSYLSDLQEGWRQTSQNTYCSLCNRLPSFIKLMTWTDLQSLLLSAYL